jgi:hypothetical protein
MSIAQVIPRFTMEVRHFAILSHYSRNYQIRAKYSCCCSISIRDIDHTIDSALHYIRHKQQEEQGECQKGLAIDSTTTTIITTTNQVF